MKDFIKDTIEIIFIVFNAFIGLFAFVGIYVFLGGDLKGEVNFYIIPMILFFIYGLYMGYKVISKIERR